MNKKPIAALIAVLFAQPVLAETPSIEELYQIILKQQAEIEALKQQNQVVEERLEYTAEAVEKVENTTLAKVSSRLTLGGYGEHHFNRFDNMDDAIDAHRFVLFTGYEFSEDLRFFSELELEHGLSGNGKPGEVELEQAYIEWDYAEDHRVKFGQFLVPVGIMNETHEPETFYGTERNNVEKNIIPATWWEAGVMMSGNFAEGFSYDLGLHSGLFIDTVAGKFKVRDGRQKNAKARANDLAVTGRLKYTGIKGLELGVAAQFQEDVTQGQAGAMHADANLLEAHASYQYQGFGLRALYAAWEIDSPYFEALGADRQKGWYVEPSYKISDRLGVFYRYAEFDNNAGDARDTEVIQQDWGINYWLNPRVVLKADWSDYKNDNTDAFNLGVGWSF